MASPYGSRLEPGDAPWLCLLVERGAARSTTASRLLLFRRHLRAQPLLLLPQLGREGVAEIVRLKHLADLDLRFLARRVGAALDPLDRLLLRLHLPQPEAGDQFLRLGKGSVGHDPL